MRRTLGALALALILPIGLATPALAEQTVVRDRTGDVLQGRVDMDGGYVVQSNVTEGDVVATSFRHGARRIVVTSAFRSLSTVGEYHGYYLRLQTPRGTYREVDVEAFPGRWGGVAKTTMRNGAKVRCAVDHRIDYARNTVRVSIPRTCLGRPRYVRATAANAWTRPDSDTSQSDFVWLDNPHNTDHDANTWTRWLKRA